MATTSMAIQSRGAPREQPNQTLYCSNLPDKLQKADLKRSLYLLFVTYGPILDIVALKTSKMRGQAHIVFRDIQAASQAMRALQGFEFFGKDMKLAYGKGKSNSIAKLDGTFKIPVMEKETGPLSVLPETFGGLPPGAEEGQNNQGTKRTRDDESDNEDAPMEEEDEDAAMEESDSD
ncbi:RNA-binding domain-containing protein [Lophium mytilinum]|uniref:RNA-binding domain-containing protein n=1 Tax=Lophium mytilinum TaxID=390894 RepID=A0A6A6R4E5_9PEZI|nr:RNA-binding domain-containing protein [Lophium mytilinum]